MRDETCRDCRALIAGPCLQHTDNDNADYLAEVARVARSPKRVAVETASASMLIDTASHIASLRAERDAAVARVAELSVRSPKRVPDAELIERVAVDTAAARVIVVPRDGQFVVVLLDDEHGARVALSTLSVESDALRWAEMVRAALRAMLADFARVVPLALFEPDGETALRARAEKAERERDQAQMITGAIDKNLDAHRILLRDATASADKADHARAESAAHVEALRGALEGVQHNRTCSCYTLGRPCERCVVGYDEVDAALALPAPSLAEHDARVLERVACKFVDRAARTDDMENRSWFQFFADHLRAEAARLRAGEPSGHEWLMSDGHVTCQRCGVVERADDGNRPCRGEARIGLRAKGGGNDE